MVDSFTRSILMKDLAALQKNPLPFAWIPDDVLIDDNILHWQMYLIGPQDTDFEGGVFRVSLKFPPNYPNEPPEMKFVTPIWHPNVYSDGRVCISILHKPGGTADIPDDTPASECWRPILNIEAIVVSVLSMLSDPNFSSPANMDASVQMRDDVDGYTRRVKHLVEESRSNLPVGFRFPNGKSASGGTAGDDFDWEPDDEDGDVDDDDDDDDNNDDDDDDEEDASGLSKKELAIVKEVCGMGFDTEAVMGVIRTLKERGKEISNDSVAEKLLDL